MSAEYFARFNCDEGLGSPASLAQAGPWAELPIPPFANTPYVGSGSHQPWVYGLDPAIGLWLAISTNLSVHANLWRTIRRTAWTEYTQTNSDVVV